MASDRRRAPRDAKRPYHHGDLRRALVEAGLAIVDAGGIEAVGLRAAARDVGVSHAAPLRHFADVGDFVAALAAAAYDQLATAMGAARDTSPDPLAAFRAVGRAYVTFARTHPNRFRLLFHPLVADRGRSAELEAASQRAYRILRDAVDGASRAGALRSDDLDGVAVTAWATAHGLAVLLVDGVLAAKGVDGEADALADTVLEHLHLGLAAGGGATTRRRRPAPSRARGRGRSTQ